MSMDKILMFLEELNFFSIFVRLSMAVIFGGLIGFGRERERRPAGLRTHILVSIGATLAMITNIYIREKYGSNIDPSRIGAQVISGIGFLGAGTIIVTGKNKVKGLTTAAGLWACACMGLAIGVGFYDGAIIGCIFIFTVSAILANVDQKINKNSRVISLYILVNSTKVLPQILKKIKGQNEEIKIKDIDINTNNIITQELLGIVISLQMPNHISHKEFINAIDADDDVIFLQEIM